MKQSPAGAQRCIDRRRAAALVLGGLAGCSTTIPEPYSGPRRLPPGGVFVGRPQHEQEVQLKRSEGSRFVSPARLGSEHSELAYALRGWQDVVVPAFSNSLAAAFRARGVAVAQESSTPPVDAALVRSHLQAGFVYATLFNSGFAPYVRTGVHVTMPDGTPLYRKFYVMTDRSFNMFSDTLPARLAYQLPELSAAAAERARAFEALAQIASQLGEFYAANLAP